MSRLLELGRLLVDVMPVIEVVEITGVAVVVVLLVVVVVLVVMTAAVAVAADDDDDDDELMDGFCSKWSCCGCSGDTKLFFRNDTTDGV